MYTAPAGTTQQQLDAAERLHKAASLALQVCHFYLLCYIVILLLLCGAALMGSASRHHPAVAGRSRAAAQGSQLDAAGMSLSR
jgi:hypothetical protein